jgi:hypothetical protein
VTFVSSTPIRRQDALNGFKQCQGDFPNEITVFKFTPNPLVAGQEATGNIAGKATVTMIENGALYKITGFKQAFQREISFCEAIVAPSGHSCPVKDNFDFTTKFIEEKNPDEPKNTVTEYDIKIMSE